jgi:hypothetical protein
MSSKALAVGLLVALYWCLVQNIQKTFFNHHFLLLKKEILLSNHQ